VKVFGDFVLQRAESATKLLSPQNAENANKLMLKPPAPTGISHRNVAYGVVGFVRHPGVLEAGVQ
jgi:hypothetical protein